MIRLDKIFVSERCTQDRIYDAHYAVQNFAAKAIDGKASWSRASGPQKKMENCWKHLYLSSASL